MKNLSKKEWVAVAVAVIFVGYTLFGGNVIGLFQKNSMNGNSVASVAGSQPVNNNGVVINDIVVGQGAEIKPGQSVSVHYILSLSDGTVIQNSKNSGTPYRFTFGVDKTIAGWEIGLAGMKVGGVRTVVIPPELAFGSEQNGSIPPNSTLIFTIELLDVSN